MNVLERFVFESVCQNESHSEFYSVSILLPDKVPTKVCQSVFKGTLQKPWEIQLDHSGESVTIANRGFMPISVMQGLWEDLSLLSA